MKLNLVVLIAVVLLFSVASGLLSASCRRRTEVCRGSDDCCHEMGRRLVCGPHLKICGKRQCCITEVEEQQEKQEAIGRNRNAQLKRFWHLLVDGEEK